MYYSTNIYWNRGAVRSCNQDSLVLQQALTSQGRVLMAAVCDGMGGMDVGECASGYLTEELVTWFYDGLLEAVGRRKPLWIIRRSAERKVYQVQRRMQTYAHKRHLALGTTMSMLVLWEKKYLLWHLGDSRIYHLSEGKLSFEGLFKRKLITGKKSRVRLLTNDHVQGKNKLTKCVGSFGSFLPDFKMGTVKSGEAFLLCSDGFWHKMSMEEIGEVLAPAQMTEEKGERRLREIGDAVMRRGESDNLSAVYVKVK